ncbi:MAG TPA: class II aldolase/adducin family protein, partial [Paracoccus sp. (in: a-proteobacteria)]|nr:class II aldolase/adducin family protein [Paracoccus sp. (in: a-proteobacteria)]
GFGCYFQPGVALWDDPQLIRDDDRAVGAITAMGPGRALLMRGNGAVVWGESIEAATVLAWYLEDMCRIELVALQAGLADSAPVIAPAEAEARATRTGRIIERMWDHLVAGDPELNPQ